MSFADELTIMRRFLRDPDGNIWSNTDILTYWNDAQREIAIKTGNIEKAEAYYWPPRWTTSHLYNWEYGYAEGDIYQALLPWEADDSIVCYPWEPAYWLGTAEPADDGYRFTHPWEGYHASPADVIAGPLHADLEDIIFLAYDQRGLEPMDRKRIAETDSSYKTAAGTPVGYWRPDASSRQLVMYPRPTNYTWDDDGIPYDPYEALSDTGGLNTFSTDSVDYADGGLILDQVGTDDTLFILYRSAPQDVVDFTDEIDMAPYLTKYIRYGCLERCLGADTDGFVPSLRDFWKQRKELGIRSIKRLDILKRSDREYRLGGNQPRGRSRHPRLPSEYPRQWP